MLSLLIDIVLVAMSLMLLLIELDGQLPMELRAAEVALSAGIVVSHDIMELEFEVP